VREVGAQRAALARGRVAGLRARGQLLLLVRHDRRLAPRALARRLQLALRARRAGFIRALSHGMDQGAWQGVLWHFALETSCTCIAATCYSSLMVTGSQLFAELRPWTSRRCTER